MGAGPRSGEEQGALEFLLPRWLECSPRMDVQERRVTGAIPAYEARCAALAKCLPVTRRGFDLVKRHGPGVFGDDCRVPGVGLGLPRCRSAILRMARPGTGFSARWVHVRAEVARLPSLHPAFPIKLSERR